MWIALREVDEKKPEREQKQCGGKLEFAAKGEHGLRGQGVHGDVGQIWSERPKNATKSGRLEAITSNGVFAPNGRGKLPTKDA